MAINYQQYSIFVSAIQAKPATRFLESTLTIGKKHVRDLIGCDVDDCGDVDDDCDDVGDDSISAIIILRRRLQQ